MLCPLWGSLSWIVSYHVRLPYINSCCSPSLPINIGFYVPLFPLCSSSTLSFCYSCQHCPNSHFSHLPPSPSYYWSHINQFDWLSFFCPVSFPPLLYRALRWGPSWASTSPASRIFWASSCFCDLHGSSARPASWSPWLLSPCAALVWVFNPHE